MDSYVDKKFGRLTVVEYLGYFIKEGAKEKRYWVRCICDCGNEKVVNLKNLKNGNTQSCGCLQKERASIAKKLCNKYETFGDITFVKFNNVDEYFICDTEDWTGLKDHCWTKNAGGYAIATIDGETVRFHRLVTNCPKGLVPDHLYQVTRGVLDNRKSNLEVKTRQGNNRNRWLIKSTSGHRGVSFVARVNKWRAYIWLNDKYKHLGYFDDFNDACKARQEAEEIYYKEGV